jgi:hypothetical protein
MSSATQLPVAFKDRLPTESDLPFIAFSPDSSKWHRFLMIVPRSTQGDTWTHWLPGTESFPTKTPDELIAAAAPKVGYTPKVSDRVKLITRYHGESEWNPVWGGSQGNVLGTVIEEADEDRGTWAKVKWDNGNTNTYRIGDLEFVAEPVVAPAAPAPTHRFLRDDEVIQIGDGLDAYCPGDLEKATRCAYWVTHDDRRYVGKTVHDVRLEHADAQVVRPIANDAPSAAAQAVAYEYDSPAPEVKPAPRSPEGDPPIGYRWLVEGEIVQAGDFWVRSFDGELRDVSHGVDYVGHVVGGYDDDILGNPFVRPIAAKMVFAQPLSGHGGPKICCTELREIDQLRDHVRSLQAKNDRQRKANAQLEEANVDLKQRLKDAQAEIADKAQEIEDLDRQLDTAVNGYRLISTNWLMREIVIRRGEGLGAIDVVFVEKQRLQGVEAQLRGAVESGANSMSRVTELETQLRKAKEAFTGSASDYSFVYNQSEDNEHILFTRNYGDLSNNQIFVPQQKLSDALSRVQELEAHRAQLRAIIDGAHDVFDRSGIEPQCTSHRGLVERIHELQDLATEAKHNYAGACKTIAEMHAAAVGGITGAKRGVVEDVADLKALSDAQAQRIAKFEEHQKRWHQLFSAAKVARDFLGEVGSRDYTCPEKARSSYEAYADLFDAVKGCTFEGNTSPCCEAGGLQDDFKAQLRKVLEASGAYFSPCCEEKLLERVDEIAKDRMRLYREWPTNVSSLCRGFEKRAEAIEAELQAVIAECADLREANEVQARFFDRLFQLTGCRDTLEGLVEATEALVMLRNAAQEYTNGWSHIAQLNLESALQRCVSPSPKVEPFIPEEKVAA